MFRRTLARTLVVATASLATAAVSLGSTGTSYAAPGANRTATNHQRAAAAADWQTGQLTKGGIPSSYGGTDWGLTLDTAFALTATGGHAYALGRISRAFETHYFTDYATYQGVASGNAMAKSLTGVVVLGENPRDFGGRNVRHQVLKLVAGPQAGKEAGRVRDANFAQADYSNTFGQAFAVIGLSRSGKAPASTVKYLLRQQCKAGYFTVLPTANRTCNRAKATADVDATAMAVQALVTARRDGGPVAWSRIRRAVRWLATQQHRNGGFGGGSLTAAANSNSTGLVSQALALTNGQTVTRAKAARYVARMQLRNGAIAYNAHARKESASGGAAKDQTRRATAQGLFAFLDKSLSTLRRR